MYIVQQLKSSNRERLTVAEIGIGYGATALQILTLLDEEDVYWCFDFHERLSDLVADIETGRFDIKCQVAGMGNTHDLWDSYNFNLSDLIFQMRQNHQDGMFDAVYLDGAHTFLHDGLAVCLLKQLVKKGGYLILDDLFWTYSGTPSEKYVTDKLPKRQRDDNQILRVQEIFLRHDPFFEKLSDEKSWRGIFRKRELVTP